MGVCCRCLCVPGVVGAAEGAGGAAAGAEGEGAARVAQEERETRAERCCELRGEAETAGELVNNIFLLFTNSLLPMPKTLIKYISNTVKPNKNMKYVVSKFRK